MFQYISKGFNQMLTSLSVRIDEEKPLYFLLFFTLMVVLILFLPRYIDYLQHKYPKIEGFVDSADVEKEVLTKLEDDSARIKGGLVLDNYRTLYEDTISAQKENMELKIIELIVKTRPLTNEHIRELNDAFKMRDNLKESLKILDNI
jgi:hypothetical protein